ncbi:MAG: DUF4265 domain-containing protein [Actinomycetota bacterium]|nr:DUF4265 domain-containing protein [Actinomycetota bacterium]
MSAAEPDLAHVIFPLEVDDGGWPPVSAERVWARRLSDTEFQLDNAPWFARGVAEGDIVRAVAATDDEWPTFIETVRWSGNCNIRVIPFKKGRLGGDQAAVLQVLRPLGVTGEGAGSYPIVALTIEPHLNLPAIKSLLDRGTQEGWWEYEEGCVSDEWLAL